MGTKLAQVRVIADVVANAVCFAISDLGPLAAGLVFSSLGVDAPFYLAGLLVLPAILLALQAEK